VSVETLGGYITSPAIEPEIKLRAIGMILDRGWGRPNQPHDAKLDGELRITIRKLLTKDDDEKD
jgi:hypothetical protein